MVVCLFKFGENSFIGDLSSFCLSFALIWLSRLPDLSEIAFHMVADTVKKLHA